LFEGFKIKVMLAPAKLVISRTPVEGDITRKALLGLVIDYLFK